MSFFYYQYIMNAYRKKKLILVQVAVYRIYNNYSTIQTIVQIYYYIT